ncbi:MAG: 3-dehydroquinate synthase [Oscillospiraceae bacterium]|nr:3-dehydroquinate synthase [Oscillospiraceae bacterium]
MTSVHINASQPYDVMIAPGLLERAGELLRPLTGAERAAVVCGELVYPLYAGRLVSALEGAGFHVFVKTIPPGEEHKTLQTYGEILSFLCENEFDRGDLVVALGGGVTGDLAGFAAASYRRGCGFAAVPTTLIAAADASVGGKTGFDLPGGKNQAGCIYQPLAVLCDTETFSTLPERELRCGLAEIVKTAVLFDRALFDDLKRGCFLSRMDEVLAKCVAYKGAIVERDEFERGERRLLNLGHSFGHAVERCSGYTVPHGEAVAIGLAMIARAAAVRGRCGETDAREIVALLRALALPTQSPFSAEALFEALKSDKKRAGGTICLVVPCAIGRCELLDVPFAETLDWLRDGGAL